MVLQPFHRRRRPLFLVLSTRHPVQPRSCPIKELPGAFRADEAAAERAEISRLRAGGADRVRTGGLCVAPMPWSPFLKRERCAASWQSLDVVDGLLRFGAALVIGIDIRCTNDTAA